MLMSDYASTDSSGKANVMGIFGRIQTPTVPCVHPRLFLSILFNSPSNEFGSTKHVALKLIDEDGKSVFEANSEMVVPTPDSGFEVDIPAVFDIANLQFEKAGTHVWRIEINGQTLPQDTRLEIGLIEPA